MRNLLLTELAMLAVVNGKFGHYDEYLNHSNSLFLDEDPFEDEYIANMLYRTYEIEG